MNQLITQEDLDECYNCMLQMCCDDNDYNWSSIFENTNNCSVSSRDFKFIENDVFKELTENVKKTQGRCIDEQFDLAILSLKKSNFYV
jgi:hypothetical protein